VIHRPVGVLFPIIETVGVFLHSKVKVANVGGGKLLDRIG
jgi:hypothetical protein